MEVCPKCKQLTLTHDWRRSTATCCDKKCQFEKRVKDRHEYFECYVMSSANMTNYRAQTPAFLRRIRDGLEPVDEDA
jgi:hypothetical protein